MNDTEIVDWIAEHLTQLTVGRRMLEISYLDDDGKPQWAKYISASRESIPNMLRNIIASRDTKKECE